MADVNDHDLLVMIKERLDNFLDRFEEHLAHTQEQDHLTKLSLEQIDHRLRVLEDWKVKWVAVIAVSIFALNLLVNILIKTSNSDIRTTIISPPQSPPPP